MAVALVLAAAPGLRAQSDAGEAVSAYAAESLTIDQVRRAIQRGINALYAIEPEYTFRDEWSLRHIPRNSPRYQELRHETGNHALASWALLAAGESYQKPRLYKRINWVLSDDSPFTFDRGMRAQMLAELPVARWQPWVRRDGIWLMQALTEAGNFDDKFVGKPLGGLGDNANGQYGVLGLWGVERGGYTVPEKTWRQIDRYWRLAQQDTPDLEPAGWSVTALLDRQDRATDDDEEQPRRRNRPRRNTRQNTPFYTRVSGPMTAGGVATLALTERYLFGPQLTDPGDNVSRHLKKGIGWLDGNFSLTDKAEASDWFFYMWTIQGVGRATGYRTFNGVDWFRDVTAEILNRQEPEGSWTGPKGRLVSTGFAVLYLSRAFDPLAIAKIRFGNDNTVWNNRPHDLVNFVGYVSDEYEYSQAWQIVELDQPVYELIESPILYLATDDAFEFGEAEVATLRSYIRAGGLLVTNAEGSSGDPARSIRDLARQLFPDRQLAAVPREHELYGLHQELSPGMAIQGVSNDIRPLMLHFSRDVSEGLQTGDPKRNPDAFIALSNIYLYVTGMNPRRARLDTHYAVGPKLGSGPTVRVARLTHTGNHDPEPVALPQLKALLARDHQVRAELSTVSGSELSDQQIAFLTTEGDGELPEEDVAGIQDWLKRGGTLWIDGAGGGAQAYQRAIEFLERIMPKAPTVPVSRRHPVLSGEGLPGGYDNTRVQYRLYTLRRTGPMHTPRLLGVEIDGRLAVVFSSEDLTCGLAGLDHWGIQGYLPQAARQLVLNGVLHAMQQPAPTPAASR